ncbi:MULTISPECIES: VanZ family protein [Caloramator]|uniref:VanZ like family protein n=1 Tax=Caloramator proteoclasticus DSM 10124 TaxID=1121262 RepID=A0A1M5CCP8_9CLOT|nr:MULTISPECIES: VanZ family protein [Caloramator]SHF52491.1 VanZ like family protein [Caloramator proteoclasticus DSM 10124]
MSRRIKKWGLVLIWMGVIFLFSSQNGDKSSENNKFIVYILNTLGIDINTILSGNADFIIRKAAHFTEYFILYFLLYNALKEDFYFTSSTIFAIIITFLYAVSDEFHQSFVPGRGPAFRDVLIDTSGGVFCMVVIYLSKIIRKRK